MVKMKLSDWIDKIAFYYHFLGSVFRVADLKSINLNSSE